MYETKKMAETGPRYGKRLTRWQKQAQDKVRDKECGRNRPRIR